MGILKGLVLGYCLWLFWVPNYIPIGALQIQFYDGDNIIVSQQGIKTKVHLACIDAPELQQIAGQRSRKSLKTLVEGKPFQYRIINKDRYGRLLAEIVIGGININRKMVSEGHAFYDNPSGKGCEGYAEAEAQARQRHLGVWQSQLQTELLPRKFRLEKH